MRMIKIVQCFAALGAITLTGLAAPELTLRWEPDSSDDLIFDDSWSGVPAGQKGYVTRASLAALPTAKTVIDRIWPTADPVEMTVVPLADIVAALGPEGDADGVVLRCVDRWESWLPFSLIASKDPYLIVYYEGRSPQDGEGWPTFLGIEDMAPYYAFVSPTRFPDFVDLTSYGMISATQIVEIGVATEAERYAPFYEGKLAELDSIAADGRALFLERCNNCHQGPGEVGGNVSQRPFMILQTHAVHNPDHFINMVTDPKQFYPETIMPRHPDFTKEHFAQLIAFITATQAK